ncbi:hypothetical protein OROHE_001459 [Orobanche hederae]
MGRAPCCDKNGLKKGPWTPEEDQKLIDYIQNKGCGNWKTLPKNAGLERCGKSCRLRWTNYLRPDIKRGRFSFEEEETIIQLHSVLGNKWSAIATQLPGRTDNEIKNYWNTHIRKILLRMGIDPVTHSPRLDSLDLSTILKNSPSYNTNSQRISQMNFSRLLGLQPLISPELIRLATSLLSSQHHQIVNHNNPPVHHQVSPSLMIHDPQDVRTTDHDLTILTDYFQFDNFDQFSQNLAGLEPGQVNEWQQNVGTMDNNLSTVTEDTDWGHYCGSGQAMVDAIPSSEKSTFLSNGINNFDFQSVLSTPSSSSRTPLHDSSSTCYNNVAEDEREISYCSDMKFDIAEILDVINDFI